MAHGKETRSGRRQGIRIRGFPRGIQGDADSYCAWKDGRQDQLTTAPTRPRNTLMNNSDTRRLMHRRSVECHGYLRNDGLWEVEARLVDTKPFAQRDQYRGELKAGDPVHDIALRLAVDDRMTIIEAETTMRATPYPTCIEVEPIL